MKIVFLSALFKDPETDEYRGGGAISNRLLLESMSGEHEVIIISAVGSDNDGRAINGVTYYSLSAHLKKLTFKPLIAIISKLLYKFFVTRKCRQIQPDILIASTVVPSVALRVKKKFGTKAGVVIRAHENFGKNKSLKDLIRLGVYGDNKKKTINQMDFVITNSDYMSRLCDKAFTRVPIHVVYPPVDYSDRCTKHAGGIQNILIVSGTPKKGKKTLCHLAGMFPEISFSVLGFNEIDKDDFDKFKNIKLIKWVLDPSETIASHDLVLVPSVWDEPFGRIAVEAIQLGRLVLVSDVGGLPETVSHNSKFIVDHDDLDGWVERLSDLIDNEEMYESEMENLRINALEYSMDKQAKRFASIIREAL